MKIGVQKLTLEKPVTYHIKVPGHLDESGSDWDGKMTITIESEADISPITTDRYLRA